MKKKFTKQYMLYNGGCYTYNGPKRIIDLFFYTGNETITINDVMSANIPVKDKYWFVCRKTGIDKRTNQQITIDLAEIVLPIFERRRPNDTSPREAIEAAKQFLAGHIYLTQLIEKRSAAYAAYAAAYAAAADSAATIKKQIEKYLIDFVNSQPED